MNSGKNHCEEGARTLTRDSVSTAESPSEGPIGVSPKEAINWSDPGLGVCWEVMEKDGVRVLGRRLVAGRFASETRKEKEKMSRDWRCQ